MRLTPLPRRRYIIGRAFATRPRNNKNFMNLDALLARIDQRYWALLLLAAWGSILVFFNLVGFTPYGIDEGAARALMLDWSIADQVAHPIVVFGMPDFRALMFIPLGLYWSGSIIAAKIFTVIITFLAIWLLYSWSKQTQSDEVALIGSGLLLIAPITLLQLDAISVGPYLLLMFGLAWRVDQKYRAQDRAITSWYFIQLLLIATVVTLHPAGLAVPAALAWFWKQNPIDLKRRNQVLLGIGLTVTVILVMQAGWIALPWFSNPLPPLGTAVLGFDPLELTARNPLFGAVPFALLLTVLVMDRRFIGSNVLAAMLALGSIIGLVAADGAWAMSAIALLLYRGTALLIKANSALPARNFVGQRGIVFVALFGVATLFMQVDRGHARHNQLDVLSPQDELIRTLALEAETADESFRVASEWPGRTMIAVKRAALPLPPPQDDPEKFMQQMKGVTHIMFAHNDPDNSPLARSIAGLSGNAETVALQPGGVIVKLRTTAAAPAAR